MYVLAGCAEDAYRSACVSGWSRRSAGLVPPCWRMLTPIGFTFSTLRAGPCPEDELENTGHVLPLPPCEGKITAVRHQLCRQGSDGFPPPSQREGGLYARLMRSD